MRTFEFHAYKGDDHGAIAERAEVSTETFEEKAAAVSFAGRMAKRIRGPVDVALAGDGTWGDRYITTANPSEHHASGYRFERIG